MTTACLIGLGFCPRRAHERPWIDIPFSVKELRCIPVLAPTMPKPEPRRLN